MSRLSVHYSKLTQEPFQKLLDLSYSLHTSSLGAGLLELVKLRVSQINGCAFCIDMHARALLEGGEDLQRLLMLPAWRESDFFSPRERAALDWAERTNAFEDEAALDVSFAELSKHFEEREIAELTFAVAVINTWNIMNVSLKTPVAKKPMPEAKLKKAS
ncbi:MAG: carboxymuconolactone decarboxylase family protein [Gammaproteobacteria bacterium]